MKQGSWLQVDVTVSTSVNVSARLQPNAKETVHMYYAADPNCERYIVTQCREVCNVHHSVLADHFIASYLPQCIMALTTETGASASTTLTTLEMRIGNGFAQKCQTQESALSFTLVNSRFLRTTFPQMTSKQFESITGMESMPFYLAQTNQYG